MKRKHVTLPALQLAAAAYITCTATCQARTVSTPASTPAPGWIVDKEAGMRGVCLDKGHGKLVDAAECDGSGAPGKYRLVLHHLKDNEMEFADSADKVERKNLLAKMSPVIRNGFGSGSPDNEGDKWRGGHSSHAAAASAGGNGGGGGHGSGGGGHGSGGHGG
ncbi:hypothetical protein CDD83_10780 [Cordyceps sp. RAO-2017]|nr:hypothetical protein CDD83_10780 [Cordyceps sp. RAO-2017]